jgi:hypothetical protein
MELVAGKATVYVQLGAFYKPVKCYVMDMLYDVDLILGGEFLDKYDCIFHYGKGCIMIRKGKRHLTVNSPALPRNQLIVDEEKSESVLSASQVTQRQWPKKEREYFWRCSVLWSPTLFRLWWPLSRLCLRMSPTSSV